MGNISKPTDVVSPNAQLQTKFTPLDDLDQDNELPYRVTAPLVDQIRASVHSSLDHLHFHGNSKGESYIDCFLLQSLLDTLSDTLLAWRTLEEFVPHRIRHLGISNVNRNNLELMHTTLWM